ncbi:M1 family metallopeptidase [Nakamurella lactea]|uniref:M1 family metallopeptidase n=1 Tax=Nakamurella lactea TaxID=459515 RepID=UPI000400D2F3|nr:M1 family metallopeptidase [Nakamurella lactea]
MTPQPRARRRRFGSSLVLAAVLLGSVACSTAVAGTAVPGGTVPVTDGSTAPSATSDAAATPTQDSPSPDVSSSSPSSPPLTSPSEQSPAASSATTTTSAGAPGGIGAAGIGDPYYPEAGNGGYDVAGYDLTINYLPESNALTSVATITATVTAEVPLKQFDFDLQPWMKVSKLTIDGRAATYRQEQSELVVTPAAPLAAGAKFTAVVTYAGEPELISGGTAGLGEGGWYRTQSGGALVAGEPFSASAWFPVNEHPADPATFAITATVPAKWKVISNGIEQDTALPKPPDGMHVSRWVQKEPIASYLVTLYIDTFTVKKGTLPDGKPVVSAFAPGDTEDIDLHQHTIDAIAVLSKYFGPYPYDAAGGIYSNENIPFALETATRPVYANWVDPDTVVHELAHQWYGDDVAVKRWSDVCLNECFASYAPWLYHEQVDGADLDAEWKQQMAKYGQDPGFWSSPLVDMGAGNEFTLVYDRGPLALHVLRKEMGEAKFMELLKKWPATYGGKNASFDDLEAMASQLAGRDLTQVFQVWFRATNPPAKSDYPASLS